LDFTPQKFKQKIHPTENLIIFQIVTLMKGSEVTIFHLQFIFLPLEGVWLVAHLSRAQKHFTRKKANISSDLAITHLTHEARRQPPTLQSTSVGKKQPQRMVNY